MSEQRAVWVVCDGCGEPAPSLEEFMYVNTSAADARADAKRAGWHYERAKGPFPALDLCQLCCRRMEWRDEDIDEPLAVLDKEGNP